MGDISPQLLQHWVTVGKTLDENQALAAFDIFKLHVEPTMSAQIDSVNIATEIARLLNTPVTLERAYDELAILESMVLAEDNIEILAKQKIGLSRGGLQDIKSPSDAQATYLYLINLVPSETVEKFKEFNSLPRKERIELREILNLFVVSLNNYAMSTSRSGTNTQEGLRYINTALEIFPGQPQVLDTRALVHISLGNHAAAIEDATEAVKSNSNNLSFKMTLVEAYILAGDFSSARTLLETVSDQNEMSLTPSTTLRSEIKELERKILRGKAA